MVSVRESVFGSRFVLAAGGEPERWGALVAEPDGSASWVTGSTEEHAAVLDGLQSVTAAAVAPHGDALAFLEDEDGSESAVVRLHCREHGLRTANPAEAGLQVAALAWSRDASRLAVLERQAGGHRILTCENSATPNLVERWRSSDFLVAPVLSADGEWIAVSSENHELLGTSEMTCIARDPDGAEWSIECEGQLLPRVVRADGTLLVHGTLELEEGTQLFSWRPRDGHFETRPLPAGREVTLTLWDVGDGDRALLVRWNRARPELIVVERDGTSRSVTVEGAVGDVRWKDEALVTALWSDFTHPMSLANIDVSTGRVVKRAARLDDLAGGLEVDVESLELSAADGLSSQCWWLAPRGGTELEGVALDVHGGPDEVVINQFVPEHAAWSSEGWGVLCPNYRGSIGFGREFAMANVGDPGRAELLDLDAAASWKRKELGEDVALVAVGASYGGYLALLLAMEPESTVSGVVALHPILDWSLQYDLSEADLRARQEALFGVTGESDEKAARSAFRERSPLHRARELTRPTLIVHSSSDARCPVECVTAFRETCEAARLPVQFLDVEGGHHGLQHDQALRRRVFDAMTDFMNLVAAGA